jgi:[acyl-carrier-protein] S-malonyltransferase
MLAHLAFVFPGQGSQSLGMLGDWPAHGRPRRLRRSLRAMRLDLWALASKAPRKNSTAPSQHPAGACSPRGWRCGAPGNARGGARRRSCGPQPGRVHRAGCGRGACRWPMPAAGARARPADAGRGAGRRGAMAAVLNADDALVAEVCAAGPRRTKRSWCPRTSTRPRPDRDRRRMPKRSIARWPSSPRAASRRRSSCRSACLRTRR